MVGISQDEVGAGTFPDRLAMNCCAPIDGTSVFGSAASVGWKPLFAKNGETPIVSLIALLYANSASGNQVDQLSCW